MYFQLPHVFMNCIECSAPRVLYEYILNNMPDESSDTENDDFGDDNYVSCDDMTDFVKRLRNKISSCDLGKQTFYTFSITFFLNLCFKLLNFLFLYFISHFIRLLDLSFTLHKINKR